MEWLQLFELPKPSAASTFFLVYFLGVVGGYCIGRAHAAWIALSNFVKAHK